MDKIQLLPDSVANQIAAGEVIQRPASVIKELVENSVDAGAKRIDVLVVDAGRTSIQVIDDGIGMSVTDARLAFERHATSKIRKADDLFSLQTMGFRGEALPSVAAVAQVTLKTRQADQMVGTCLSIAGSRVVSQEPVSCPVGSNFMIENLFFNVPVRRKFLKSNSTELNNIVAAFQRIALVYPGISFTLHSNGQEMYNLPACGLHQRIVDVFDSRLNKCLLPMDVDTSLCKIKGFVGKPESSKKKTPHQFFFVNGRYMKHPYFQKAVLTAYERLIPQGEQVPFFVYFTVNPEDIDVNIHPTKTEIKFQNEAAVWQILNAAVREAVGKFNGIPSIDFDTEGKPDIPLFDGTENIYQPPVYVDTSYNPFMQASPDDAVEAKPSSGSRGGMKSAAASVNTKAVPKNWETLYEGLDIANEPQELPETDLFGAEAYEQTTALQLPDDDVPGADSLASDRSQQHLQYKGAYILTTVQAGLMVTDQERAHERILYERYMQRMNDRKPVSQKTLFPEMVQFSLEEMVALPNILPEMEALGFELTDLGGGTYSVNAIPAGLEGINVTTLIQDMVATAVEHAVTVREELFSSLASSMARHSAIPHGQYLSNEEMENIISELLKCENHAYTPTGKKIHNIVPHTSLAF